jgi:hydroxymethylpyrimidine/phosphomethylpyrimidine kinase
MRIALTIAGSDSGGGAGLQADLKTFAAHGVYGLTAVTAVTAQNSEGVLEVAALPPSLVASQIDAVVGDFGAAAVKVGMVANAGIIAAVAASLTEHGLANVVLDTVMIAKSGARLLDDEAIGALVDRLLPLATVVTPNALEAERLVGIRVTGPDEQRLAAERLVGMGARAALVKGGHLEGDAVDVLFDGRTFVHLGAPRIDSRHTHGTGCTLSAAIAARLALGDDLAAAARAAKDYVTRAIAQAPGLGHGHGPLQHFPQ